MSSSDKGDTTGRAHSPETTTRRCTIEEELAAITTAAYNRINSTLVGSLKPHADDIFQETCIATYQWADALPETDLERLAEQLKEELPKVMATIARNKVIDLVRRKTIEKTHLEAAALSCHRAGPCPTDLLTVEELRRQVRGMMDLLRDTDFDAYMVAREVQASDGRPNFADIGTHLDMEPSAAHAAWRRAVRFLRTEAERRKIISEGGGC